MKCHLSTGSNCIISLLENDSARKKGFWVRYGNNEVPSCRFYASFVLLVACFGCELNVRGVVFISVSISGVDILAVFFSGFGSFSLVSSALCFVYAMSILALNIRGLGNADTGSLYRGMEFDLFPKAIASDHAPIILLLSGIKKKWKEDFKFESKWLLEEDFSSNVKDAWESI
ncbi:hypothetical protein V6N11_060313 [Hibiscus sabdariffa]|uniref:Uncharacterized protein n=1 Tax=Hibiscus sabdariffa TaxID=183260 RepID=A0ABR2QPY5_9ROSI